MADGELTIESTISVNLDEKAFARLFQDRNGPVVLHIANAGRQLLAAAKREAPKSDGLSGSGKPKKGIRLRESGEWNMVKVNGKWTAEVKFTAEHAAAVVQGSQGHVIPEGGSGHLFFYWEREKRDFGAPFPNRVNHPGHSAPNDFITRAAKNLGLKVTKPVASA